MCCQPLPPSLSSSPSVKLMIMALKEYGYQSRRGIRVPKKLRSSYSGDVILKKSSYTKGWMSFIKCSDAAPVCHSKPLDSVKNWNGHFFWVDSTAFPLSLSLKSKILSKDPRPKLFRYDAEACEFLRTHTASFRKFPEPFLCWVGISRYYTLDENSYPTFWDGEEGGVDLFAFIRHSDPTKVRVGERNLTDRKVKLLKMTEGRTVALDHPSTAASGCSGDSICHTPRRGLDGIRVRRRDFIEHLKYKA
ncbi:hypothetical protein Tco_0727040 [Tanacetum coccineum]|uniref:Uncharacterized protein n=1 Tax=Tanacetum coccineum TaxID=301880 RepID=A0ABQ4YHA0_9ASTR